MKTWENIRIIRKIEEESRIRFEIVNILEEHPKGLLVTQIREKLKEVGFDISQPAVSKHLAVLKESYCLVSEVKRRDERLKRKVTYYQSLASLYSILSDKVLEKVSLAFADALEEMGDKLPRFENVFSLQNFLTCMAEAIGGDISVRDELYSQISNRKPYGELAKLLWEFQNSVSFVDIALEDEKWMNRASDLFIPLELKRLKDRYNVAMNVIIRSLQEDERFINFLNGLFRESREPLKRHLQEAIEFVRKHKRDSRLLR